MSDLESTVGFVGLGTMGSAMALRLIIMGRHVVVHNRTPSRTDPLVQAGAELGPSLAGVANTADVVLSCLRDGAAVASMYLGSDGLIAHARPGQIFCEHGTFAPSLARRIGIEAAKRDAHFLDVPVTGGPERARKGELTAMAGGDSAALQRVLPVLAGYTSSVHHLGVSGQGLELKLVNQLLVSVHIAAAGEAVRLIAGLGLNPEISAEVLSRGWAQSTMLSRTFDQLAADRLFETGATIDGLVEVQQTVAQLLTESGSAGSVFDAARAYFTSARDAGHGHADPAYLARPE
jgi:3-hydroxyisobutyrate dehydrogenase-like beta-hydroxyacid dehydrogenase